MKGAEILTKFTADTSGVDKATKGITGSFGKLTSAFTLGNLAAKGISKAIGVMTANMDNAIRRADIMNNFPKVMSNLGIGADDANKAISKLSDRLTGLPTSLDDAANAVQRLTAKNGDVAKSTDLFLAMNNAILAGGASSQIQSAAIEQMSQAYAKGKPDMMEWRAMLAAMPAQLKQVATAMGYVDADALGQAIREQGGEAEFTRMINTFTEMNKKGVNGFKSLEEQARNATGGIATSVTNMKTAITRGLANMLNSLNTALEPFGGIGGVLSKIGKVGEKVFTSLGNAIIKIVPTIMNIVKWLQEHKTLVISLTAVIGTFITAFQGFLMVKNIIMGVNAALSLLAANPIGLVIAAVAALVVGFVVLWKRCEKFRNFFIKTWEGIKKVVSTVVGFIKKNWKNMILFLINPFAGLFKMLYDNCDGFRNKVQEIVGAIKGFFVNVGQWAYNTIIAPIMSVVMGIVDFVKNVGLLLIAAVTIPIDFILKKVIIPIGAFIRVNVLDPIVNFVKAAVGVISGVVNVIATFITDKVNRIKAVALTIFTHVRDKVLNPVKSFFTTAFNFIWTKVNAFISKVKNGFNRIKLAVETVFNGVKSTITNVFSTIATTIKTPINAIIKGINKVLDKINDLEIPDWVPGVGGKHTNFKHIPQLNTGTNYVPEDTLAMIHKGEAVVPKKFNPYANGVNGQTIGQMNAPKPSVKIIVNNNMELDPLGQVVSKIKTFSGGAKNDYNYGQGV